ncbi:MAG: hypothetical protein IJ173_12540 [Kiritimatiellae bacterium]|nr:hypothetical protein [Kiritimatiellia bacterium]MBQ8126681.1 hypothetical protein [Kiritimatiellia bacterium]
MKANSNKILINTVVLYCRMLFAMFVSFFTTRIVLRALGVEDYGLVNVIGGVVGMFGFISISLSTACLRYFGYELGRKDDVSLNRVFSMIILLYAVTAIVIVGLFESVGLWYVSKKLVCSPERVAAAIKFFHIMVASVMINWFTVPYTSLIIAHEEFSLYSFLSIVDVILKLISALGILWVRSCDHLVAYGIFLFSTAVLHAFLHISICFCKYPQSHIRFYFEKEKFFDLCKFNGWRMFGVLSWTTSDAFVNLLLNSFFGPVVNAARAIAMQLNGCVRMFTANFLTASNPQLIKQWAAGDRMGFYLLLNRISKLGYFLVFFFALPLFVELPTISRWWLGQVPEYVVSFTRLVLFSALPNTLVLPLETAAQAVGNIRKAEGMGNGMLLWMWPLSWLALRFNSPPAAIFVIAIGVAIARLMIYFIVVMKLIGYSKVLFVKEVLLRLAISSIVAIVFVWIVELCPLSAGWHFLCVGSASVFITTASFLLIAATSRERAVLRLTIRDWIVRWGR